MTATGLYLFAYGLEYKSIIKYFRRVLAVVNNFTDLYVNRFFRFMNLYKIIFLIFVNNINL